VYPYAHALLAIAEGIGGMYGNHLAIQLFIHCLILSLEKLVKSQQRYPEWRLSCWTSKTHKPQKVCGE
jgi:hypothetical protein